MSNMACSTPIPDGSSSDSPYPEKKTRMCRFFLGTRGCRDGDDCLYKHVDDRPTCKYYFSKWGCWNGKWCRYAHSEPESEEPDTSKQFYNELNEWLGPAKTADDSILSTDSQPECTTPKPVAVVIAAATKKFVSRGTQTKTTPDFVHCGECGEEFKSSRTLQQSLERHYIHKLASADFHHLRFFKRHPELQGGDPFCSACGEVFGSIEEMLQHMGRSVSFTYGTASVSVRHGHQSWFKQLVQPFVYRDLEVLETEEDMIQSILEIYFIKQPTTPAATVPAKTIAKKVPSTVSPMKLARKLQQEVNNTSLDNVSPYIHCEECGEIFDDPDSDEKLRDHYADMLTRADGLHVKPLRKWINTQAQCSVCKKTFLSGVALLQHVGSKERVTASNNRQSASKHSHLINEIADVFVGRDLGVEGYVTQAAVVEKLQELTWTGDPCHPNEVASSSDETAAEDSPFTEQPAVAKGYERQESASDEPMKEGVDEALQMARYFCRVNEWQAKMSYPEYVKDDQERTRNHGFTVAEVGYLATKGLTPRGRGVFNILNALYRRRRNPLKSVSTPKAKEEPPTDKDVKLAPKSPKKDVSFSEKTEDPKKDAQVKPKGKDDKDGWEPLEEQGSPTKGPKPKRKKRVRRRRRSKGGLTDQDDEADEAEEKKSASKGKASATAAKKGKNKAKDSVIRKRERILSRDIEGEDLNVTMQVHMDGTIFVREKLAEGEEEVTPKKTKDSPTLQQAVDHSLHTAAADGDAGWVSLTSRVFAVHEDGTIDIVLQVAGIPMDPLDQEGATPSVQDATGDPEAQISQDAVGAASPLRNFTEQDSAIIAAKVSPRSEVVVYNQEGDVKSQIIQYLLTAATEQETSLVKEGKGEGAVTKPEDASTKPEDAATKPKDAPTKPEDAATKPKDAATKPEDASTKPEDAATKPEDAATKPEDASTKPEAAATKPGDASTKPKDAATKPGDAVTESKDAATKPEDAATKPTVSPPVEQQSTVYGEVVKLAADANKVMEKIKKLEKVISASKPKEQDSIPEKKTNQQDTVVEQSVQPETSAVGEVELVDKVTSSKVKTEEDKTQTKPCEPIPDEDTVQKKPKEDTEQEFCMVAAEDVRESSSEKAVPATGSESGKPHAPTDINGNADPAPSDKMEKGKIVTEVNNNTETVAGVTTAPSECRI